MEELGTYLDTVGLDHGWVVVFDGRPDQSWEAARRVTAAAGSIVAMGHAAPVMSTKPDHDLLHYRITPRRAQA